MNLEFKLDHSDKLYKIGESIQINLKCKITTCPVIVNEVYQKWKSNISINKLSKISNKSSILKLVKWDC